MIEDKQRTKLTFIPSTVLTAVFMLIGVICILFSGENKLWLIVGLVIIAVSVIAGIVLIMLRNSKDTINM